MGRAEELGGVDASFVAALKKAKAKAVVARVLRAGEAGRGGAVVERTTKTVADAEGRKVTETIARPVWMADAWHLERRYPEEFGTGRRELAELREIVSRLVTERTDLAPLGGNVPVRGHPHPREGLPDRPAGSDPVVVTGLATLSRNSTEVNDSSRLVVRGPTPVADSSLAEFLRMIEHDYFRGMVGAEGGVGKPLGLAADHS